MRMAVQDERTAMAGRKIEQFPAIAQTLKHAQAGRIRRVVDDEHRQPVLEAIKDDGEPLHLCLSDLALG